MKKKHTFYIFLIHSNLSMECFRILQRNYKVRSQQENDEVYDVMICTLI